jgi:hypothetical protein
MKKKWTEPRVTRIETAAEISAYAGTAGPWPRREKR